MKQMCLLIYHLEPKLSSNAVQIILVSTRTNVQLNIQLSQGSAATNLRGGGKFYSSFLYGSYRNTTVTELLKSVHICQSYPKNITCTFFYRPRCSTVLVRGTSSIEVPADRMPGRRVPAWR